MAILEYSAEKHLQYEKDDSYNTGYDSGYGTGYDSGIKDTNNLFSWLKSNHRETDIILAIDDPGYLAKLFDEFEQFKKQ